jgi:hypothetical protein
MLRRWKVRPGWIIAAVVVVAPFVGLLALGRALNHGRQVAGSWIEPTVARVRGGF